MKIEPLNYQLTTCIIVPCERSFHSVFSEPIDLGYWIGAHWRHIRALHLICYVMFFVLDNPCPGTITNPISYDPYCLELVEDQTEKGNAENRCRDKGGRLVEIESADMQSFISAEIERRMGSGLRVAYWWIGASVNTSTRYWEWTDGKIYSKSILLSFPISWPQDNVALVIIKLNGQV